MRENSVLSPNPRSPNLAISQRPYWPVPENALNWSRSCGRLPDVAHSLTTIRRGRLSGYHLRISNGKGRPHRRIGSRRGIPFSEMDVARDSGATSAVPRHSDVVNKTNQKL